MVLSFTKYIPIRNPLFRKERSTQDILLGKLKFALRNHQVYEAWETFQDFRTLYGYPEVHVLNQLIVQLSYSSNQVWMRKACDLVLQIVEEKSGLLHADTLTKLALSLARLKMPSPATVILRLMLDKGSMPSMHLLSLIVFHIVKTEVGTNLASNYLFQVCDFHNCLNDRQAHHAVTFKADTLVFNLVLDACVRFKLSLKGLCLVELMSLSGTRADAHSIVIISQILEMNGLRDELKELKDHVDGFGWLECAHDILDDVEATGSPMDQNTYMLLMSAYQKEGMQREAKALLKQMKKVGLEEGLSDDVIDKQNLCEETLDSLGKADLAIALAQILKDEDQTVFPLVYNFNSSISFSARPE
ncbi:hypothetical protein Fmac_027348 [Flemingia macrophylla]|uniref:At1g68980-like TPR repeats domain-containing protein n=1 Tax=Flemingia macrophylla TaxID=520843 RepID=A0ABD1LHG3_9FABA